MKHSLKVGAQIGATVRSLIENALAEETQQQSVMPHARAWLDWLVTRGRLLINGGRQRRAAVTTESTIGTIMRATVGTEV
jgi:hypothetical protein